MPRVLHLVDVSGAVYAGSYNKHSYIPGEVVLTPNGYRERMLETGGVHSLFNIVYKYGYKDSILFCFDSNPIIKKGWYPEYKANRTRNDAIDKQREIAEIILRDCSLPVLKYESYEADDIIYSAVKAYKHKYEHIYIHTGDSDLYFLVSDNVSVLPISSRSKTVDLGNYETTVRTHKTTPYNTIMLWKMIDGVRNKNVPSLSPQSALDLRELFYNHLYAPYLGDKDWFRSIVEVTVPEALLSFDLNFPLQVELPEHIPYNPDYQRIKGWAYEVKHRNLCGVKMDLQAVINSMFEKSLYIEGG